MASDRLSHVGHASALEFFLAAQADGIGETEAEREAGRRAVHKCGQMWRRIERTPELLADAAADRSFHVLKRHYRRSRFVPPVRPQQRARQARRTQPGRRCGSRRTTASRGGSRAGPDDGDSDPEGEPNRLALGEIAEAEPC